MQERSDYRQLQTHFGAVFNNLSLIEQAFTTRGYQKDCDPSAPHNETLEFLGDAALHWVVVQHLFKCGWHTSPGNLSEVLSIAVSKKTLAGIAETLELKAYARIAPREKAVDEKFLCDLLESFIGAVVTDLGIGCVNDFCEKYLFPLCDQLLNEERTNYQHPKGLLQERVLRAGLKNPEYNTRPARNQADGYISECYVGKRTLGKASGPTKKEAETNAAKVALKRFPESSK